MGLRYFSISHIFSLIIGIQLGCHLEYIKMLNDARVASLDFLRTMYALPKSTKKTVSNQVSGPSKIRPKSAGLVPKSPLNL